jgi:hypothetical protein
MEKITNIKRKKVCELLGVADPDLDPVGIGISLADPDSYHSTRCEA